MNAHTVGADLLDETAAFIDRFCAFPSEHCLPAITLWTAHAHAVEYFHTTPRLALLSPEAGSGKTRSLEILELLTPEAKLYFSPSPSTIFRLLAKTQITLLIDECDTIFTTRGKDDFHEDLRALLNSGYKRGSKIPRCVGPHHDVQEFGVFAAAALAGLGDLPDTIMSRSVIIRMRRRARHEKIEPFRSRVHEPEGHAIRVRLSEWCEASGPAAGAAWPVLPEGVTDRLAEVWEPLIAIADQAGGHWRETARIACVELCKVADDRRVSLGVRLLGDLRVVFGEADALHTETILERLVAGARLDGDAPWADLRGKPLDSRGLASFLKRYGIKSTKVWAGGRSLQGYRRADLWDAWERYLPPVSEKAEGPEGLEGPATSLALWPSGSAGSYPDLPEGAVGTLESGSPATRANTGFSPHLPDLPDLREPVSDDCEREAAPTASPRRRRLRARGGADCDDEEFL